MEGRESSVHSDRLAQDRSALKRPGFPRCRQQRSEMNRFSATHKYSWNFEYEWVNSIEIQLLWFIRIQYNFDL